MELGATEESIREIQERESISTIKTVPRWISLSIGVVRFPSLDRFDEHLGICYGSFQYLKDRRIIRFYDFLFSMMNPVTPECPLSGER